MPLPNKEVSSRGVDVHLAQLRTCSLGFAHVQMSSSCSKLCCCINTDESLVKSQLGAHPEQ